MSKNTTRPIKGNINIFPITPTIEKVLKLYRTNGKVKIFAARQVFKKSVYIYFRKYLAYITIDRTAKKLSWKDILYIIYGLR